MVEEALTLPATETTAHRVAVTASGRVVIGTGPNCTVPSALLRRHETLQLLERSELANDPPTRLGSGRRLGHGVIREIERANPVADLPTEQKTSISTIVAAHESLPATVPRTRNI
jgi:hypothetical protein